MDYTQQSRELFAGDIYATATTGIEIEHVETDYAKCSLKILDKHKNAAGVVMGGAIFTLADFTFAVAANAGNPLTVSLSSTINFMGAATGEMLFAEAKCKKNGKNICFYTITVTDETGKLIAEVTATGFRK